jgi:uracil-DNA glycosylase family 4
MYYRATLTPSGLTRNTSRLCTGPVRIRPRHLAHQEKRQIAKQCRAHLLDTVELYKPSVIIPIGSDATNQTVGKSVQITKVRGLAEYNKELDAVVLPMLHPGFVARYPQHTATFAADCNSLARLVDNGLDTSVSVLDSGVSYSFVEDLQFLVDMEPEILFFDTETTGFEFFKKGNASVRHYDPSIHGKEFTPNPAILTMQFCVRPGEAYLLVWDHPENPIPQRRKPKLVQQLIQLLCNPNTLVIGQNSTFDSRFMRACTGVKYEIGGDTLMLAALVDENAMSKGQDTLVKQYVPDMAGYADRFNSQYDKSRMWEVPLDELLMYGCGDVDTGFRLYEVLIGIVEKDELLTAQYQYVSMPGINTFVDVEMEGIYIDHEALSVFQRGYGGDCRGRVSSAPGASTEVYTAEAYRQGVEIYQS